MSGRDQSFLELVYGSDRPSELQGMKGSVCLGRGGALEKWARMEVCVSGKGVYTGRHWMALTWKVLGFDFF